MSAWENKHGEVSVWRFWNLCFLLCWTTPVCSRSREQLYSQPKWTSDWIIQVRSVVLFYLRLPWLIQSEVLWVARTVRTMFWFLKNCSSRWGSSSLGEKKLTTPQRSMAPDLSAVRWQIVKPRTARRERLLNLVWLWGYHAPVAVLIVVKAMKRSSWGLGKASPAMATTMARLGVYRGIGQSDYYICSSE